MCDGYLTWQWQWYPIRTNDDQQEKLNQNEELAELRADTSLTKTQMGIDAKIENDRFKQRDVRILKGPRR